MKMGIKMKINKFIILIWVAISTLPISINCMEDDSKRLKIEEKQRRNIASLLDLAILPVTKNLLKIYETQMPSITGDNSTIIDIICKYLYEEIYHTKVVSCMVNILDKVDIFGNDLLKLYEDRQDIPRVKYFLNVLDEPTKICLTNWFINQRINEDGEADPVDDLIILLIQNYQSLDFYDYIIKKLFTEEESRNEEATDSEEEANLQYEIQLFKKLEGVEGSSNINFANPIVIAIRNVLKNITTCGNQNEEEIPDKKKLNQIGNHLLFLFNQGVNEQYQRLNYDDFFIDETDDEITKLFETHGSNFMQKVIDLLFTNKFMKSEEKPDDFKIIEFIDFVYPHGLRATLELERIFSMLQERFPQYIQLIYKKHLVKILGSNIRYISEIQEVVSTNLAKELTGKFFSVNSNKKKKHADILCKLSTYYVKFGLEFINDVLLYMVNNSGIIFLKDLQDLYNILVNFADSNKINKNALPAIYELNKLIESLKLV